MCLELTPAQAERLKRHLRKSKRNSEAQKKNHAAKYATAAEELRNGGSVNGIHKKTGLSKGAISTAKQLIASGEI